jgi:hypothetical protein
LDRPAILMVVEALSGGAAVSSRLPRSREPPPTTPLALGMWCQKAIGGRVAISNDAVAIAMMVLTRAYHKSACGGSTTSRCRNGRTNVQYSWP